MPFQPGELLAALESEEFVPYFQPIVELRTGQLAGVEVLARWNHPHRGLVLPDEFIPSLERAGLIENLTQAMLRKAFAIPALSQSAITVSVNLSPLQLLDDLFP